MNKDIKILEDMIESFKDIQNYYNDESIAGEIGKEQIEAIERLIERNKELEKFNDIKKWIMEYENSNENLKFLNHLRASIDVITKDYINLKQENIDLKWELEKERKDN